MSNLKQMAVQMNRSAIDNIVINFDAMPAERQDWKPLDLGRSALSQVQECAIINPFFAAILTTQTVPAMEGEAYAAAKAALATPEAARAALAASADTLQAAIETFPDEKLGETVTLPWGEGMVMTFGQIMLAPYWNMTYHQGQIAYIQTLYGDNEMHGKV
ncbi:MAG: DinB family protein [Armatimonadetes bacterium]|nr:DinB family protein [Armatimonadota bacterium]